MKLVEPPRTIEGPLALAMNISLVWYCSLPVLYHRMAIFPPVRLFRSMAAGRLGIPILSRPKAFWFGSIKSRISAPRADAFTSSSRILSSAR
ncbi:hypothetical protein D3C76_1416710 [compost metagenome]